MTKSPSRRCTGGAYNKSAARPASPPHPAPGSPGRWAPSTRRAATPSGRTGEQLRAPRRTPPWVVRSVVRLEHCPLHGIVRKRSRPTMLGAIKGPHSTAYNVCIVHGDGTVLLEHKVGAEPVEIVALLQCFGRPLKRVGSARHSPGGECPDGGETPVPSLGRAAAATGPSTKSLPRYLWRPVTTTAWTR